MRRRALLALALAGTAWLTSTGHTPYRQWNVYRRRYLLILTSRSDERSYRLGQQVAATLAAHVPASRARVTRAPYLERVASLLSSKQLDVAVLARRHAVALLGGRPPFTEYGPVPLRALVALESHLLVCRDDFPALHAYLVAQTLSVHRTELAALLSLAADDRLTPDGAVPIHPGAFAYFEGRPPPEEPDARGEE